MDIKKGDTVVVIAGKDKGKRGEVLEVRPRENRVIVENVNVMIKHEKSRNAAAGAHTGGRVESPAPLDRSNVMLVNPNNQQPTKVSHALVDGKYVRSARKGGEVI
jgi:large subunit ribosomal protein L24